MILQTIYESPDSWKLLGQAFIDYCYDNDLIENAKILNGGIRKSSIDVDTDYGDDEGTDTADVNVVIQVDGKSKGLPSGDYKFSVSGDFNSIVDSIRLFRLYSDDPGLDWSSKHFDYDEPSMSDEIDIDWLVKKIVDNYMYFDVNVGKRRQESMKKHGRKAFREALYNGSETLAGGDPDWSKAYDDEPVNWRRPHQYDSADLIAQLKDIYDDISDSDYASDFADDIHNIIKGFDTYGTDDKVTRGELWDIVKEMRHQRDPILQDWANDLGDVATKIDLNVGRVSESRKLRKRHSIRESDSFENDVAEQAAEDLYSLVMTNLDIDPFVKDKIADAYDLIRKGRYSAAIRIIDNYANELAETGEESLAEELWDIIASLRSMNSDSKYVSENRNHKAIQARKTIKESNEYIDNSKKNASVIPSKQARKIVSDVYAALKDFGFTRKMLLDNLKGIIYNLDDIASSVRAVNAYRLYAREADSLRDIADGLMDCGDYGEEADALNYAADLINGVR